MVKLVADIDNNMTDNSKCTMHTYAERGNVERISVIECLLKSH